METKELKITISENHEIDWQESAKQEKIVFKKKDNKPRSWEEYCEQQMELRKKGYFTATASNLVECNWANMTFHEMRKNVLPSKKLAEAFLAMMQLMSLRQAWVGDWQPNFNSCVNEKWCIEVELDKVRVVPSSFRHYALSFPTLEMAVEFKDCFKDLLEIAKPLI
jgi:hypothetical protein